jgi:hypothetical protein
LALKKGYVTIETVEESPEENPEDYQHIMFSLAFF